MSKWQVHGRKMSGLNFWIGYFESEDDTARARGKYIQDHNQDLSFNANASGVIVARERSSVYQGVKIRDSLVGRINSLP